MVECFQHLMFLQLTKNLNCMIINNNPKSQKEKKTIKIVDRIFHYKVNENINQILDIFI